MLESNSLQVISTPTLTPEMDSDPNMVAHLGITPQQLTQSYSL
jgi:hypothetical protein